MSFWVLCECVSLGRRWGSGGGRVGEFWSLGWRGFSNSCWSLEGGREGGEGG